MTGSIDVQGPRVEFSLDVLARGRPLPPGVADALVHLFGARVGRDGLSRAFQPAFPGVRSYAIHTRLLPDRSVGLEVVGLARSGAPVWVGERTFARGHDGSIELHHGAEDAEPDPQSRNMLTDVMRRELALLDTLDAGPGARITHDAQGASSYRYALHGFVFADETEEGVPVRSRRALEPSGDRSRLVVAMIPLIERLGRQHGASPTATASAVDAIRAAETPGDMALVEFSDVPLPVPEGERGVAGGLGRALLTSPELPDWRAALFVRPSPGRTRGDTYRRQEADDHERRLASDVREALDQLAAKPHVARIRALRTLGRMAGNWVLPEIRKMASAPPPGCRRGRKTDPHADQRR